MTRVGIVTAFDFEARTLGDPSRFDLRRCAVSGAGADVAVRELAASECSLVVSWGTAGALAPHLKAGDVYLPERVLTRNGTRIGADAAWRERFTAAARGACTLASGTLLDSPRIVLDAAEKARLHHSTGAGAVDMESGPVAEACARIALPFLVIRCIIDEADDRLPALLAKHAGAAPPVAALLVDLALRPGDWPSMMRLARRYRRAKASLHDAARILARCTRTTA